MMRGFTILLIATIGIGIVGLTSTQITKSHAQDRCPTGEKPRGGACVPCTPDCLSSPLGAINNHNLNLGNLRAALGNLRNHINLNLGNPGLGAFAENPGRGHP
jgi:hypothetical protein